ncbi:unnamed protein product [Caenorhabditis bovis]|uniref:tRNA-uridine aminocarboxypropyltransferase 1 n=1 Tax=Caenorhabditis bovis TaxID=2654633 RepID=A0A8S1FFM3_9PELO|nr:unnamed protein product [Caenorhabditis bovis]
MDPTYYGNSNFDASTRQRSGSTPGLGQEPPGDGGQFGMQQQLGKMVWEAGSKQFKDTFNSYGRIDLFRPYFDVEPAEVRNRLIRSFIPRKPSQISVSPDLYGPTMIILTMVALLLYNMKASGIVIQNGTLMGTAMFTCFGSWILIAGGIYITCFLLSAEMPFLSILSTFGYSLTSHCVLLLLTSLFHPSHDHLFFFVLLGSLCLPSALRMALIVCNHSRLPANRMILIGVSIAAHLLLITYLHFGFHVVVEELDEIVGDAIDTSAIKESMSVINELELRLSSYDALKDCKKAACAGCKQNRMYFCYDCRMPMPGVFMPHVTLPCLVDIVKHPLEKNSKSSALHCKILAPEQTRVFDYPDVHDYRNDDENERNSTVVVFPSKSAISIEEFVRTRGPIRRIIVLDCTWFQVGTMQKTLQIQGLQHVCLQQYRTAFWRPQHNVPDTGLATIEAIYYALKEYQEIGLGKQYKGEFDDLLYWFFHTKHLVDERQRDYQRKLNEKLESC